MHQVVGISEMIVTQNPADRLVTYSLGSCVGLTLFDPAANIGGLIHCMLPLSKLDKVKAEARPAMFVDTGVYFMLKKLLELGAVKENLVACVAGGAAPLDVQGSFKIGERNFATLRKILWKNGVLIAAQDTGGTNARTMTLDMPSGTTTLKSQGKEWLMGTTKKHTSCPALQGTTSGLIGAAPNAS